VERPAPERIETELVQAPQASCLGSGEIRYRPTVMLWFKKDAEKQGRRKARTMAGETLPRAETGNRKREPASQGAGACKPGGMVLARRARDCVGRPGWVKTGRVPMIGWPALYLLGLHAL